MDIGCGKARVIAYLLNQRYENVSIIGWISSQETFLTIERDGLSIKESGFSKNMDFIQCSAHKDILSGHIHQRRMSAAGKEKEEGRREFRPPFLDSL